MQEEVQGHRGEPRASGENQGEITPIVPCQPVIGLTVTSYSPSRTPDHTVHSLTKPLIPLTKTNTHEPPVGSGKGSGEKRGATHPKTSGFRPRQVFLCHNCGVGRSPRNLPSWKGGVRSRRVARERRRHPTILVRHSTPWHAEPGRGLPRVTATAQSCIEKTLVCHVRCRVGWVACRANDCHQWFVSGRAPA